MVQPAAVLEAVSTRMCNQDFIIQHHVSPEKGLNLFKTYPKRGDWATAYRLHKEIDSESTIEEIGPVGPVPIIEATRETGFQK